HSGSVDLSPVWPSHEVGSFKENACPLFPREFFPSSFGAQSGVDGHFDMPFIAFIEMPENVLVIVRWGKRMLFVSTDFFATDIHGDVLLPSSCRFEGFFSRFPLF